VIIRIRVNPTPDKPAEVVAFYDGRLISTDAADFAGKEQIVGLTRGEMAFMASLDLGENWKRLATAPTIFQIRHTGDVSP
jgi:hypothetical protein